MRPLVASILLLAGLAAFVGAMSAGPAWAGSRYFQSDGGLPYRSTDGVSLAGMQFCRGSVQLTDGGNVTAGSLQPYYYDSVVGWVEGPRANACTLDSTTQVDGGVRQKQVCDFEVASQFGRAALVANALLMVDAGPAVATVRLECWGPQVVCVQGGCAQP